MIDKNSLIVWMTTLTAGTCAVILAAGSGAPLYFMAATAFISLAIAAMGLRELFQLENSGASRSAVSASTARYMGLIYTWGALALFVTYFFVLPEWREWPVFFGALALVAAVSLLFAATMSKDAERGKDDATLLKLGRILTIVQFVGTVAAVIGLMVDPDKQFFNVEKRDWAAQTIFLFGAIALAALSAAALFLTRDRAPAA
jgi:hypothetical protein